MSLTIKQVIHQAKEAISRNPLLLDSAMLDAELLLCHVLDVERAFLRTWPEKQLSDEQTQALDQCVARRCSGEPLAYITGQQAFWTLDLKVDRNTLIPRPETELLVEQALHELRNIRSPRVLDLGTGSGAIALAIASERPDALVFASDISSAALAIARENAADNHLHNVIFVHADWAGCFADLAFDLVISNPPYIAEDDPHLAQNVRDYEPSAALIAADQGLSDIRIIVESVRHLLKPGGWVMLEHGWKQSSLVRHYLSEAEMLDIRTLQDLAGHDRVSLAQRKQG